MKKKSASLTKKVITGVIAGYGLIGALITLFIIFICLFAVVVVILRDDLTFIGTNIKYAQAASDGSDLDPNSPTYYYDMALLLDIDKIQSDWNSSADMKKFYETYALGFRDEETPGKVIDSYILLSEISQREEINSSSDVNKLHIYCCYGCWLAESSLDMGTGERLLSGEISLSVGETGHANPLGDTPSLWTDTTPLNSALGVGTTYICKQENATLDDSKRAIYGGSGNLFSSLQAAYISDTEFTRKQFTTMVTTSDEAYSYLKTASESLERKRGDITWIPDSMYNFFYKGRLFLDGYDRDTHNTSDYGKTVTTMTNYLKNLGVDEDAISELCIALYMNERYYRHDMDAWPNAENYSESSTSGGLICALAMMKCEGLLEFQNEYPDLSYYADGRVMSGLMFGSYETYTLGEDSAYSKLLSKIESGSLKYNWDSSVIECAKKMQTMWTSGDWGSKSQSYYKYYYAYNTIVQGQIVQTKIESTIKAYYDYQDANGVYIYRLSTEEESDASSSGSVTDGEVVLNETAYQVLTWVTGAEGGGYTDTSRDKDLGMDEAVVMSIYNRANYMISQGKVTNLNDGVLAAVTEPNQFTTVVKGSGTCSFTYGGKTYNVPRGKKGEGAACVELAIKEIFSTDSNREVAVKHLDDLYRTGASFRYVYYFRSDVDTASGTDPVKCGNAVSTDGRFIHYCYEERSALNGYTWWGQYALT